MTKPERDKSFDVVRSQNISTKKISTSKNSILFTESSKEKFFNKTRQPSDEASEELEVMSAYFKKKDEYKKQKASVKT